MGISRYTMDKRIIYGLGMIILMASVQAKVTYNLKFSGQSMMPALQPGYIKVQTTTGQDSEVGDIVCFNYDKRYFNFNGRYVCHRVIQKYSDSLLTSGDNNKHLDPIVLNKHVALKVIV